MRYQRQLAQSQVPPGSIYPVGYIDRMEAIAEEVRAEHAARQAELQKLWADDPDKED